MIQRLYQLAICYATGRSTRWPAVRKAFLAGKTCAACGGTKGLEAHHREPFRLRPDLELIEANLFPLCTNGPGGMNCHFVFGHCGLTWGHWNPTVGHDAERFMAMRMNARAA